jgi:hypothetical protein
MDPMQTFELGLRSRRTMDRRSFLAAGSMSAVALSLPSPGRLLLPLRAERLIVVEPGSWNVLWDLVRRLARPVAYEALSVVSEWLTALQPNERGSVSTGNTELQRQGYGDASASPTYGENGHNRCVYYPVGYMHRHELDGIVPFYDFCTCTCKAQLATPTMMGLTYAAEDLVQAGIRPLDVAQMMIPDRQVQQAVSSTPGPARFGATYSTPDYYLSEDGTRVYAGYERIASDRGEVTVIARRDNEETLLNRTYTVAIPADLA